MGDGAAEDRQAASVNPYKGKTQEELLKILTDASGPNNIKDKEAYRAAWKEAQKGPAPAVIALPVSITIPERLKNLEYRFLLVDRQSKKPTETDWPKYAFDQSRLLTHLSEGGNYGIAPGFGGLCVLDADEPQRLEELGIIGLFAETFTVSNNGGARQHKYFTCNNPPWKKLILTDPELKDDTGHPKHLGEVFCQGNFQVVGPGSIHPSGRRYEVTNDAPLQEFTRDEIEHTFSQFVKREIPPENVRQYRREHWNTSKSRRIVVLHVEDFLKPDNPVTRGDEIQGAHPVHGSDTGMNLTINPKKEIWHCFRCNSGGDALLAFAVREGIIQCHEARPGALKEKMREVREALRNRGYLKDGEDSRGHRDEREKSPKGASVPDQTEVSAEIHSKAWEILEKGSPFDYMIGIYNRNHIGDTLLGKSYLAILGCTLCTNTGGIHPGTTGKSGYGKSHSMEAILHQYPPEYVFDKDFSDMAWFYTEMKPGTVIFLDDTQNLKDVHKDIIKKATTRYQKGYERAISDPKMKKVDVLRIPPRCSFWVNSVEGAYDLQFLNRQINLATNEKQTEPIYEKQLGDSTHGTQGFEEDEKWQVAQEIHRILKKRDPVRVMAPILDDIDWHNKENPRNYPMFVDTICGVAAINQFQRERDPDGTVIATREDVEVAKEIWDVISQEQRTKLNPKLLMVQLKIVEMTRNRQDHAVFRTDLAKAFPTLTSGDLTNIIKGRRNRNGVYEGGLLQLVPGLEIESVTSREASLVNATHTQRIIYNGNFNQWSEFKAIATWKTRDRENKDV